MKGEMGIETQVAPCGCSKPHLRVMIIDPSFFTLPYDAALAKALAQHGSMVELIGRSIRKGEIKTIPEVRIVYHYYSVSERLRNKKNGTWLIPYVKGFEHAWDMARALRYIIANKPDVIHFQWMPLPVIDRFVLRRLKAIAPVLFTVHDTTPFRGCPTNRFQMLGWGKILDEVDAIIVHSEYSKNELCKLGVSEERIAVIPHGVLRVQTKRDLVGFKLKEKRILIFGEIKPYKGLDVLLRAFALLPRETRYEWKIHVAGRPRMEMANLYALAEQEGIADQVIWDLRFIPEDELDVIFSCAEIVAFPYKEIDASGALMMALPYGKAIVASKVGGFAEILRDGENALLFDEGNYMGLAAALERLIRMPDLRRRVGARAVDLAEMRYSWDEIAARTEDVYRLLLEKSRSGSSQSR